MGDVASSDQVVLKAISIIQAKGVDNVTDLRNWLKDMGLVDVQIEFLMNALPDIEAGRINDVLEKLKEL